jgi:1,3-beta-galactosyl-N-acetylhexosamine phosphorylase
MGDNKKLTGNFTLPAQKGMDREVQLLCGKWGADAIRDSDGTVLSPEIFDLGHEVYSTICLIRADQKWAKMHPDQCQQKFLVSFPVCCTNAGMLKIKIIKGYSSEQFAIDNKHNPQKYWQVFDRTTGKEVKNWAYIKQTGEVAVASPKLWHIYTVNFLVYQIWETTSMYNYITNNWTGEHQRGVDPRQPLTYKHLLGYLEKWLNEHQKTDVVRFTSLMYQFPLIKNENRETIYLEWTGYLDAMSALALDEFEKEYGYRLKSEDIIDEGYLNNSSRVPNKKFLDWMTFVQKFVRNYAKQCVDMVHKHGRKAVLFFCDHWIGTEPYLEGFDKLGFDGIIGPCLSGVELRRITDVPGDSVKEVRLYPYFFKVNLQDEPVFQKGGDPVKECKKWWKGIRRALLRKQADRIGFGGYLDLAMKCPDFLDYVGQLADEFRTVLHRTKKTAAHSIGKKVVILDVWGKLRSWMHNENWPQGHIPECLCGLPVDVEFISFDDIRKNGIAKDIGVIINWGRANSAWSGGENWIDEDVLAKVRQWIYNGGGFIGVEDPTACEFQGRFFQLADVLGVQKEVGNSLGWCKNIKPEINQKHFILDDVKNEINIGANNSAVYLSGESTELLAGDFNRVLLSANAFGKGRAVYMADYLHTPENIRLAFRAIIWSQHLENKLQIWFSSNYNTDCAYYPQVKEFVVMNNTNEIQKTKIYNQAGKSANISLKPMEMKWFTLSEINKKCGGAK